MSAQKSAIPPSFLPRNITNVSKCQSIHAWWVVMFLVSSAFIILTPNSKFKIPTWDYLYWWCTWLLLLFLSIPIMFNQYLSTSWNWRRNVQHINRTLKIVDIIACQLFYFSILLEVTYIFSFLTFLAFSFISFCKLNLSISRLVCIFCIHICSLTCNYNFMKLRTW